MSAATAISDVIETEAALDTGPYKFFDYFVETDVTKFAGRNQDVAEVVARVTRDPTLVLYGRSGLGKTSLLLAGVFPELRPRGFHPILVRTLDKPLTDLRNAVATAVGLPCGETTADLPDLLKAATLGHEAGVVIVCDQFEEFFIRQRTDPAERRAFIDRIAELVDSPATPVKVVFSLREDFLAEMDDFKVAMPEILGNTYRLLPLTAYGARQAIIAPLQHTGMKFDQRLVAKLVDLLAPDFDPLLLQIACTEVYREAVRRHGGGGGGAELTEADLDALGGLDGLFGRYLQLALEKLPQGHIVLGRAILDAMITYEDTKRAVTIEALMENDTFSASNDEIGVVLQCLERQRLVRMDHRGDKEWYELSHERLVKSILTWFRGDKDFSNFREVRDTIANAARREYRTRPELLLGADQIREVVHPYRQRLRLTESQREFMFWSAMYRCFDGVQFWAEQFGLERCDDVVLKFFTDARPDARLGAATTARALRPSVRLADACFDAAIDDADEHVRRAAGRSLVTLAGPAHIERLQGLLANRRTRRRALDLLADLRGGSCPHLSSVSLFWQWRGKVRLRQRQFRREHDVVSKRTRRGALTGLIAALGWLATSGVALVCAWVWAGGYAPWTTSTAMGLIYTGSVALLFGPPLGALLGRSGAKRAVIHGREGTWFAPILVMCAPFMIVTALLAVPLTGVDGMMALGTASLGFGLVACVGAAGVYAFRTREAVWPPEPIGDSPFWSLLIGFGPPLLAALLVVPSTRWIAERNDNANTPSAIVWVAVAVISFVATLIAAVLTETARAHPVGELPPVAGRRRRFARAVMLVTSVAVAPAYLWLFGRDSIPFAAPRYTIPVKAVAIHLKANQPDSAYFRLRPAGGGWHLVEMPSASVNVALGARELLRGGAAPTLLFVPAGGVTLSATRAGGTGPERVETVLSISGVPELADGQTPELEGTAWKPFIARLIEQPAKSGSKTWRAELNLRLKPGTFSPDADVRIGLPAQRGTSEPGTLLQQFAMRGHDSATREYDYSLTRLANGFRYSTEVSQAGGKESVSADLYRGVLLREIKSVPVDENGKFAITLTFTAGAKSPPSVVAAELSGISGPAGKRPDEQSIEIPLLLAAPPRTSDQLVLAGVADSEAKHGVSSLNRIIPDANLAEVVYRRGLDLAQRGKYQDSLPYLARARFLAPSNRSYLNGHAWSLLATGKTVEALTPARQAAGQTRGSLDADDYSAILDTLAHAEYVNENWARAVAAWTEVTRVKPDYYQTDLDPLCADDGKRLEDAKQKAAAPAPIKPRATPGSSR